MWYRTNFNSPPYYTGYAESHDGVSWTKPSLGLIDFRGSKDNNLVWVGDHTKPDGYPVVLCVFKDTNPDTPADQRYKATGIAYGRKTAASGLQGLVSSDGLRWRLVQKEQVVPAVGMFDTHNITFWDAPREQYVTYTRGFKTKSGEEVLYVPSNTEESQIPVRCIRRAATKNFKQFPVPELIEVMNPKGVLGEHLYKNAATPYYRRPDVLLMFPKRFVEYRKLHSDWPFPGLSDIVFMSSRDGIHWDRRFRKAFMRPGLDSLNWHERAIEVGPGLVPTGLGEMSLYFVEHYRTDSVRIRRGVLRVDGLVSLHASYPEGELITKPVIFEGNRLHINFSTSAVGSVRIELLDAESEPLDGLSLAECPEHYGDEIDRVVTWKTGVDISRLAGKPVRLRIVMTDADLYSFHFAD